MKRRVGSRVMRPTFGICARDRAPTRMRRLRAVRRRRLLLLGSVQVVVDDRPGDIVSLHVRSLCSVLASDG